MRGGQNEDQAFVIAALGTDLPDIEQRESAIAYTRLLHPNDIRGRTVLLPFEIQQQQVSMGILATLNKMINIFE